MADHVTTALGPVDAASLGVTAVGEALLSVYPGAQYAYNIDIDRAAVFAALKEQLLAFKNAGGQTIVDTTGMFHGRDVYMHEHLQEATGVNIVATTGLGPERLLGGYFLTPQTNPPTPWPAEKFADLFSKELTDGMVAPRIERRQPAGACAVTGSTERLTATDEALIKGGAIAAHQADTALVLNYGADAAADMALATEQGIDVSRVLIGHADRRGTDVSAITGYGAFVGLNNVGVNDSAQLINDGERATLVSKLFAEGRGNQVIVSTSTTGCAVGHQGRETGYAYLLTDFADTLRSAGLTDEQLKTLFVDNPRTLLAGN